MGYAFQHLVSPKSRFMLGRAGVGLVATLGLWATAHVAAAVAPSTSGSMTAAGIYRQASESFDQADYAHALDLLDHAPEAGKPGEQADVWNLRGAIYLHQRRYDKARAAFNKALEKDAGLWAARFNLAEIDFRQGKYSESSKEFEELLGRTSRWTHSDEHGFLQYKLLLTQLLAGQDQPAQAYLKEHRGDRTPPLMYYYLNAALEHHRGRGKQAEAWLAQADARYTPVNAEVFAESFRSLGWYTERSERLIAAARRRDPAATTAANVAVVELMPGETLPVHPADLTAKNGGALALPAAAPVAVKPAFRTSAPPAPTGSVGESEPLHMPPPDVGLNDLPANGSDEVIKGGRTADPDDAPQAAGQAAPADSRAVYAQPIVLGRPAAAANKPKATPAASSSPGASAAPASSPVAATATPPTVPPKPEFTAKYEQAYVQFLQKNYAEARRLLDEADAIQANQTTSVNLRAQIFKHFYETAYAAYKQHSDYLGAIAQLDEADATQPNQPDALNLRGLTFSKLKKYDEAESAFRRAIQADPQFWAARFNYAELPFNYRNYTAARARFEELSAQTDASKQPREVELTQFKIFLTLLLEGKVDGARSFMGHLSFSGKTPARYFCQAALEFYGGSADKAQVEIDSANKEFVTQPKLVDIFKESFYRIGWLNDPGNPVSGPPPTAASSPAAVVDASPAASPAETAASVSMVTPAATLAPSLAMTQTTPAPEPSAADTAAMTTPAAGPVAAGTATPEPSATPVETAVAKPSKNDNLLRVILIGFVLITILFNSIRLYAAMMNHKARGALPVKRSPLYADEPEEKEADEVETPR